MKILGIFAHPDDETFGPGGTLARYALTGHTVRIATFTRGEAGSLGPAKFLAPPELARLRSSELNCAARALHAAGNRIYDFPDGKLADLPDEQGLQVVGREIEGLDPDVVITFHIAGISGHPDHRTVSRWCLEKIRAGRRPPRLLGFGLSVEQARRAGFRRLVPIPTEDVTHVIDVSHYLEFKLAAIECHKSQAELWERIQTVEGGFDSYARMEHFTQVWPAPERRTVLDTLEI